jgi:hypothetical protein
MQLGDDKARSTGLPGFVLFGFGRCFIPISGFEIQTG